MKTLIVLVLLSFEFMALAAPNPARTPLTQPLRVFIRAGVKTHGPGQHDHPRFLAEWRKLLQERGAQTDGAMEFPTVAQLENTDVLVFYAAEGGTISPSQRGLLDQFLKRGGGLVVIHDAVCGTDPHWFKTIVGGAWEHRHSKWLEGDVSIYFLDQAHPITRGISNFDLKDEIYWDLHLLPEAKVLASSFHTPFVIAPQLWVYEKENYRAFVCLQGHEYTSFNLPHFRAILLRGIAWAGRREADVFLTGAELASLRYPEGGPTAPEKAAAKIKLPSEFSLRLVAAEPLIEKPISMDWDARARLWVAETPEYPNGRRVNKNDEMVALWREENPKTYSGGVEARPARDRISILTDTDGDGRMDKKVLFYEGLELVTSLVLHRDGVIVAQAPEILWLRDTDNDGKADRKQVLFTGFGTSDTHAVISNLRWGMDGWVYATQGYSGAEPKSPDGKTFGKLGSGVLRFKPDGSQIEMVCSKGGNTWGLDFSWDGELFFTQANGTHLQHVVLPESVLARGRVGNTPSFKTIEDHKKVFPAFQHKKQPYVQIDNVGGFTAASGSAFYTGGAWPEAYNYTHFVSEPTVNLVHIDWITPVQSSFAASKEAPEDEFIVSTDLWFRPIHQRIGPDGALYLLDFYNQAAVHNDTRGPKHGAGNAAVRPDRDHHFGRIWRVQHANARRLPAVKLDRASPRELIAALEHPNGWVRETAHRLLLESGERADSRAPNRSRERQISKPLAELALSQKQPYARIRALWILESLEASDQIIARAINDPVAAVRKNALQIAALSSQPDPQPANAVLAKLADPDPRVRLHAILALTRFANSQGFGLAELIALYPRLQDVWLQSAAVSVASSHPLATLRAVLRPSAPTGGLSNLVAEVSKQFGASGQVSDLSRLVIELSQAPAEKNSLKEIILANLAADRRDRAVPPWSADLQNAFDRLLTASDNGKLAGAAVPLISRWDTEGRLRPALAPLIANIFKELSDTRRPDGERAQLIGNLLGAHRFDSQIIPSISRMLPELSTALFPQVITTLAETRDPAMGRELTAVYPRLSSSAQALAFNQIVRRSEWAGSLLDAVKEGKISPVTLGPAAMHRLRSHPDRQLAQRANSILDEVQGPEMKEKNELIARFGPLVQKSGNVLNGKKVFSDNCAACHKFNGEGRDLAPDLTGMGAHGPTELLVHILDPNRVVEPNFVATSVETRDDQVLDGIVARENSTSVVLRNAAGDFEVKRDNIKSQRSTGMSLMPNGFEALSEDGLRDLLTFLGAGEGKYRTLDLRNAFTANSTRGIYVSEQALDQTLRFKRFGLIKYQDVPFELSSPARHPEGKNLVVLKGGTGFAKGLPQKVAFPGGISASKLHFLSGIGGWAFPSSSTSEDRMPVLKTIVHYANGESEEWIFKNGQEFADYIGNADVPGSQPVPDLVKSGQVRYFSRPLKSRAIIDHISLESYDNRVAPTVVAITAEMEDNSASITGTRESSGVAQVASLQVAGEPRLAADFPLTGARTNAKVRVLIVGGGSSHDFNRWFNQADSATLQSTTEVSVNYTDQMETVLPALKEIDVLYLSNNQPMTNQALREAIVRFANSGRGLLLVHPALWYNWQDWPDYNRVLVGGGSRSHDKYGEFEVTVTQQNHPIMQGVSMNFKISDELYHFAKDAHGSPIQVLATGKAPGSDKVFPVVWTTQPTKARIVCITLGHDGQAHEHPDYKRILQNSLRWAARKGPVE